MDRRTFLRWVGAGAATTMAPGDPVARALGPLAAGPIRSGAAAPSARFGGFGDFDPVPYPLPLPGGAEDPARLAEEAARLARFVVRDELTVPPGYRVELLAVWGDRFGPADRPGEAIRFGFNADYVGLLPIPESPGDFWMMVNHEYISGRPWLAGAAGHGPDDVPDLRIEPIPGSSVGRMVVERYAFDVPSVSLAAPDGDRDDPRRAAARQALRRLCRAATEDLGCTILHVRQRDDGGFDVVADSDRHRAVRGSDPRTPTFGNCGGGITPWGTFLTCEENFQDLVADALDARGEPFGEALPVVGIGADRRTGRPFEIIGLGADLAPAFDGRDFGWVCAIDPRSGALEKLHALGRFRHENVALRAEPGRRIAAYMGDDRRGGHVWKFVSRDPAARPDDPASAALLRAGTLHVAHLAADHRGTWIPLEPATPLQRPRPDGSSAGFLWLPERRVDPARPDRMPGGRVRVVERPTTARDAITVAQWIASVEAFAGRPFATLTLGDLVAPPAGPALDLAALDAHRRRVILLEAFLMANACGGTPTARPECIDLHPHDRSAYVAFTDANDSSEGGPDRAIFPESSGDTSRAYGAIFRIAEDDDDPAATTFAWGRFVTSGEITEGGAGFACADNLRFDAEGNLWLVCDISTSLLNRSADRDVAATAPGTSAYQGVFGNSAIFVIPTRGPEAGRPVCFATGPMECELTGPVFSPDGRALLLAVQHPGEYHGPRGRDEAGAPESETRRFVIADRAGGRIVQERLVPIGSNWPSDRPGDPPRPAVVCITRDPDAPRR